MDWLRSEDLKEEKVEPPQSCNHNTPGGALCSFRIELATHFDGVFLGSR